jgi:hypothetical protein
MPDPVLRLPPGDQKEIFEAVAAASGRPSHLIEKDVWVVWALGVLFESSIGTHLSFKGGTSLSKAYKAIDRFSEDIDLTYDIREIIPDLVGAGQDAFPSSRSMAGRWTDAVRKAPQVDCGGRVSVVAGCLGTGWLACISAIGE